MSDPNAILEEWNRCDSDAAVATVLPCNGCRAWAQGLVERRPFATEEQLFAASDEVWRGLDESQWQEAFDSHPRLGEVKAKAATAQSLNWSAGEQSAAKGDDETRAALAEGNRAYEAKFGRVFLLCATGRSAEEMLAALQARIKNDASTELLEAAEQQRLITRLRLGKWLGLPPLTCAELIAQCAAREAGGD